MPDNYSDNPEEQIENKISQKLTVGQKIAVGSLAIFAVLVIGMWMAQFKKSIQGPFIYNKEEAKPPIGGLASEERGDEDLRAKDTDGDGLSDWDELNVYKTSPYLEDSDSDGFLDKEEAESGNDPNCPDGRDCYGVNIGDEENSAVNSNIEQLEQGLSSDSSSVNQIEQELGNVLSGQSDAATLRKMLIESGMDEEMLNQISDEDLMKSYKETLSQ